MGILRWDHDVLYEWFSQAAIEKCRCWKKEDSCTLLWPRSMSTVAYLMDLASGTTKDATEHDL
eukprot:12672106-Ditylum_brightwellii.AAC.1